jgi:hypothetical protein
MSKSIMGAFGTIFTAIIVAIAFGSVDVPDPEREVINTLPLDSETKDVGNTLLDARDTAETIKTAKNTVAAVGVLIAAITAALGIGFLSRR